MNDPSKKYRVHIDRDEHERITRRRNPNDRWSGEDTAKEHTINGFMVLPEDDTWQRVDFVLDYDPTGQSMYLVYALYDDGDSFSRHQNLISMISLLRNLEDAKTLLAALTDDYKKYQERDQHDYKPLHVHLPIEDRVEEVYTGTWKGYFAHLRELKIESLGGGMSVRF